MTFAVGGIFAIGEMLAKASAGQILRLRQPIELFGRMASADLLQEHGSPD